VSVRLSVSLLAYHVQISPNFPHMLPVVVAQSFFDGNAMLGTSSFVDNIMFSHIRENGREAETMHCFIEFTQGGSTGGEYAI